jgi:hypothetical protein
VALEENGFREQDHACMRDNDGMPEKSKGDFTVHVAVAIVLIVILSCGAWKMFAGPDENGIREAQRQAQIEAQKKEKLAAELARFTSVREAIERGALNATGGDFKAIMRSVLSSVGKDGRIDGPFGLPTVVEYNENDPTVYTVVVDGLTQSQCYDVRSSASGQSIMVQNRADMSSDRRYCLKDSLNRLAFTYRLPMLPPMVNLK